MLVCLFDPNRLHTLHTVLICFGSLGVGRVNNSKVYYPGTALSLGIPLTRDPLHGVAVLGRSVITTPRKRGDQSAPCFH